MPSNVLDSEPPYVYTSDRPDDLDFITGIGGREISVGPRLIASGSDTVDRTLTASTTVSVSIAINTFANGVWPGLSSDQGFLLEKLQAGITFTDASGKIQVLNMGLNNYFTTVRLLPSLPFMAPALSGSNLFLTLFRPSVFLRRTEDATVNNGPTIQAILLNTDGAASHAYRMSIYCIIRAISNVFTDGHVSYPG